MPARTPQKLCGPYQQSAKSKLHLPRLTSSSLALEGQTQTCSQFSRWFRHCCSAPLCNTDTTNTSAPTVVTGPNLYFIDVCTVTLDKWTQYSSECTWLEREITFSYFFLSFFFFPKVKSVISPSLTHHKMETADTLLLHYILTFSPHWFWLFNIQPKETLSL